MPKLEISIVPSSSGEGLGRVVARVQPNLTGIAFDIDFEVSGVQAVLEACAERLRHRNRIQATRETSASITKIDEAIMWLQKGGIA